MHTGSRFVAFGRHAVQGCCAECHRVLSIPLWHDSGQCMILNAAAQLGVSCVQPQQRAPLASASWQGSLAADRDMQQHVLLRRQAGSCRNGHTALQEQPMRPEFEAEVNPRVAGISYTKVGWAACLTKAQQRLCPPGTDMCVALPADLWQHGSAGCDGQAGAPAPCASGSQV